MSEYRILENTRRTKQFFTGVLFLTVLVGGWFYPLLGFFIPLCMVAGIGIGFLKGRKWCDWFCPRGSFFDAFVKPLSPTRRIHPFFKSLTLRLGVLAFLMSMMIVQIVRRWPDPYGIGMFFVLLLTITTVLGIVLALAIHQRTWCCFCPIGSLSNWVGRKRFPLTIDSKSCTECKVCQQVCPMQIAPFAFKKDGMEIVKDGDCLKCGLCVSACPKKALDLGVDRQ
jgi:ferredoxin-type protein NapH